MELTESRSVSSHRYLDLAFVSMAAILAALVLSTAILSPQSNGLLDLERAAAAHPSDVQAHRRLASAYERAGRRLDAVTAWRKVTELAPDVPGAWYALGHAYNAVAQEATASFADGAENVSWRQLLTADGLVRTGHFTDAFAIYRAVLDRLPSMITIHDAVARIYERTGHPAWAARERTRGALSATACKQRTALCEYRAGRYATALTAALESSDPEARYWRARAASQLARAAFQHLEKLPDSAELHAVRATAARDEDRHQDAVTELTAAVALAPGNPVLTYELAAAHYAARDFDYALRTLMPLLQSHPDDVRFVKLAAYALLQLRRPEEALPLLQRASAAEPGDTAVRLALGRAHLQRGDFTAAIPLLEPHLGTDEDGSLHVQLARAYSAAGNRDKAAALLVRSQELRRISEERNTTAARRTIEAPK
jgi:predicted Zn-dependent protease